MRWYDVEIEGAIHRVPAARARGRLWFHWRGQTYVVESTERARRGAKTAAGSGVLTAPMPGKITRVAAQIGETVTKGQVLVVMEAMKMEYTLQVDVDGRVGEVNATVGANVPQGAILIKVIPQ